MPNQPDFFDPSHIGLRKQAEGFLADAQVYLDMAKPFLDKAKAAEEAAKKICPHDDIVVDYFRYEDDYGSSVRGWTVIEVRCAFCDKWGSMDLHRFNASGLTERDVLLGKGEKR